MKTLRSVLSKTYRQTKAVLDAISYNAQQNTPTYDLLILDDFFPNPISGFRFCEFNHYYDVFDNTLVMTTGGALNLVGEKTPLSKIIKNYQNNHPQNALTAFNIRKNIKANAAYLVFLNNAYAFLPYLEKHNLPFVFMLYPGGGFKLNDPTSDHKLKTVCASPLFKGMMMNQKIIRDYVLQNSFCQPEQAKLIFGGLLPIDKYPIAPNRSHFGYNKKVLDVCFMANKYMEGGLDKGFDVFAGVAQHFANDKRVQFHVVGGHIKADITNYAAENVIFHGSKTTAELNSFFETIDVMLSPNRAFVLDKGAFDGFPTGCCVEASLKGVAMIVSDPLSMNINYYQEGREIDIITPSVADAIQRLNHYLQHPDALRSMALAGQQRSRVIFSETFQLQPRMAFLEEKLEVKARVNAVDVKSYQAFKA
jgi:hypothetical protein